MTNLQLTRLARMKLRARGLMSRADYNELLIHHSVRAQQENTERVSDAVYTVADELRQSVEGLRWTIRIVVGIGLPMAAIIGALAHRVFA